MELLLFFFQVAVISFSGVISPGPVTATAIMMGSKNRYAGPLISTGHAIVEIPLMILIMLGLESVLNKEHILIIIGLTGGVILIIMAIHILLSMTSDHYLRAKWLIKNPIFAGIVLTAGNPYFLIWWASIGLALATTAREFGIWAFGIFAAVHWLCDISWLTALSFASFKGLKLLDKRVQQVVWTVCSAVLMFFGFVFIYKAAGELAEYLFMPGL